MNKLKKELSLSQIIAMAAGGMIAAWMVEIKFWFELSGPGSLWSLVTCAVLVLPLCFIYSELTSMLPFAGGENVWISNAFNWNTGWFSCWALILLYVMAMPTVSYGIASMLSYFVTVSFIQVKIIATIILIIWYVLTNFEIKHFARIQSVMFWGTLIVSIFTSITIIFSHQWSWEQVSNPWFVNGFKGYGAAVGLLIMKFVGFDLIPQLAEETNFPRKNLWKGFVGSLFLTVLIYGLAVFAVGGVVTTEWVMNTDVVDPRVADLIGKHYLGVAIVIMGSITCLTTLSGFWLSASRTLFGAARQHQITKIFTAINKHGQPYKANIAVGILAIYFTAFAPESWINYIYSIYGITAGFIYLMVSISFLKLRKMHPDWNRPYKIKAALLAGVVSILFTIWIIYSTAMAMTLESWLVLGLYFVIGTGFWIYAKQMQKRKPEEWSPIIFTADDVNKENVNE